MLTKMQTLRSSVPNIRPASGTQAPGVLYVNFADLQLGVMNTAGDPQDLLAVTFFSDQAVYAPGDIVVEGGNIWVAGAATGPGAFNPAAWLQVGGSASVSVAPPSNPSPGQFWFNPTNGQLHIFYVDVDTGQWVSVSGFGGGGGSAAITPPTVDALGGIYQSSQPNGNQPVIGVSDTGALLYGPVGYVAEAGHAVNADNAGTATTAGHATTADSATNATNATTATNAGHANTADSATNAGYATNAGNADTLDGQHAAAFAPASHTHAVPAPTPSSLGGVYQQSRPDTKSAVVGVDGAGNLQYGELQPLGFPTGNVRAWVAFNGSGVIGANLGITGIQWAGTGLYVLFFEHTMPDTNYACSGMCGKLANRNDYWMLFPDNNPEVRVGDVKIWNSGANDPYNMVMVIR